MHSSLKLPMALFLACSLFHHGIIAELICEDLPTELCALSIASSGKRCVLETYIDGASSKRYTCKTSEVVAEKLSGYIENDQCVDACGLDRESVGISSDAFLNLGFPSSLCSPECYDNCPNIVDLYYNLAAGEGVFLPEMCAKQKRSLHRGMYGILSNGDAAVAGSIAPAPL
ncbi:hypothetical protein F511_10202 [Dorcoceras hygrometricum]|uniref:PAR1 protein n=1 Tax=Dorcoceras hygrometricum TaxID=472368 RepID=A0A2Z7D8K1_9LAMI|nr:hypothetical protein F511_10202 [Dorcoceras hygrometricum]